MNKGIPIPGLRIIELKVHKDNRGWFKENWRISTTATEINTFRPSQNNVSHNQLAGVTRGFHAEPWDKYISLASGEVFGAWIDLREGDSYGHVFYSKITKNQAVFVPAGVANAFQALEDNSSYIYLVNGLWDPAEKYSFVSLFDESISVPWPIPLSEAIVSDADRRHPSLNQATSFKPKPILVSGASGQLGEALLRVLPNSSALTRGDYDLSKKNSYLTASQSNADWIVNAAAYTNVDEAESEEGRILAWKVNAQGVGNLANQCNIKDIGLLQISSDYVFNGEQTEPYLEDAPLSPINVYGQTKVAGELLAATVKRHYIVRTSWLIGSGNNFVRTIYNLAVANKPASVVADQIGRLTFTSDLAKAIRDLVITEAPFGAYNITNSGSSSSWFEIAKAIYSYVGADVKLVSPLSSEQYVTAKANSANRPKNSVLNISKFEQRTGRSLPDWKVSLSNYLDELAATDSNPKTLLT
jgi:dTDP-4-dehydrorhamnose 3,5-epimerase